jgi:hypothetical protein
VTLEVVKKERKNKNMKQIKPTQAYINQDRARVLLEKWAPVLDYSSKNVSAIEDDHTRLNTAMLLENQESWCLNEAGIYAGGSNSVFGYAGVNGGAGVGATGGGNASLTPAGDNYATGDNRLPKILIPMIRRTFPELISNEIVGVQPMSGPVGLAFALRYKYGQTTLGGNYQDNSDPNGSGTGT